MSCKDLRPAGCLLVATPSFITEVTHVLRVRLTCRVRAGPQVPNSVSIGDTESGSGLLRPPGVRHMFVWRRVSVHEGGGTEVGSSDGSDAERR
jgi:hypothetical protein